MLRISLLILLLSCFTQSFAQVKISSSDAQEDLRLLVQKFEEIHYNPYFKTSKITFNNYRDSLTKPWPKDSIFLKDFMRVGMQLTARMSGGHSVLDWQNPAIISDLKQHSYLPICIRTQSNHKFLVGNTKVKGLAQGDEIISINEIPIDQIYTELMSYLGGIEAFQQAQLDLLFPLLLFFHPQIEAPYKIQLAKQAKSLEIKGSSLEELSNFLNTQISSTKAYELSITEDNIAILYYNSCQNYKEFKRFLKQTFKTIKRKKINKLIIDIRENRGGDSGLNDLLINYIARTPYRQMSGRYWKVSAEAKAAYAANPVYERMFGKAFMKKYMEAENQSIIPSFEEELIQPKSVRYAFKGTSCVLIGPKTFSSANLLADAVKTYKLSTLIGQSTGEYTNDFGELLNFRLPNSQATVFISSTCDIGAKGNAKIFEAVEADIKVENEVLNFAIEWINSSSATFTDN